MNWTTYTAGVVLAIVLLASCPYREAESAERTKIYDARRQMVGDLYKPCDTCRTQIRNDRREIIGYIEGDGDITDARRKKIGEVDND